MKGKIIFFSIFMLALSSSKCIAQAKPNMPKSIISTSASIRTYYDDKTLKAMSKGELVELYIERMKVIIKILPNLALASKPGVTMTDLGIPDNADNRKALDLQGEATQTYIDISVDFLRKMLPYSDKGQIVTAILFYEQTLKSLHDFDQQ
ncbi:hypothetical protein [Flavobacterium taihuense]|uniref:Uncharacterized protein n=1 Tax=Flavobacterium taihuense TaxID=2857508 RepID=A0ABS6XQA6_9FLAO|nr:hypothetical protein [Flavobacterium taihuense]MBW4358862.1 hypothetical protein [Flavobacterium taihuense]